MSRSRAASCASRPRPRRTTMKTILVTNDDGVRSRGHSRAGTRASQARRGHGRRPAHRSERDRPRADAAPSAAHRAARAETSTRSTARRPTASTSPSRESSTALPDLVVSGINKGYNLGDDVTYSGTVAGALEGALLGIPGIAVSLERASSGYDFRPAAAAAAQVAELLLSGSALPPRTFLNINVPTGQPKGIRVTVQAKRNHVTVVDRGIDPRGQPYYWIEEGRERLGAARSLRLPGGARRLRVGHAAAAGPHRLQLAGAARRAVAVARGRGRVGYEFLRGSYAPRKLHRNLNASARRLNRILSTGTNVAHCAGHARGVQKHAQMVVVDSGLDPHPRIAGDRVMATIRSAS